MMAGEEVGMEGRVKGCHVHTGTGANSADLLTIHMLCISRVFEEGLGSSKLTVYYGLYETINHDMSLVPCVGIM